MSSANYLPSGDSTYLLAKLRDLLPLPLLCARSFVTEIASTRFVSAGDAILLLRPALLPPEEREEQPSELLTALLLRLAEKNFLRSAHPLEEGLAVSLARVCVASGLGCRIDLSSEPAYRCEPSEADPSIETTLFARSRDHVLVTCVSNAHLALANFVERTSRFCADAMGRVTNSGFTIHYEGAELLSTTLESLRG